MSSRRPASRPQPAGAVSPTVASPVGVSAVVDVAVPSDLSYIVGLQKAHAAALGFLPRQALKEKIHNGQVLLARVAAGRADARTGSGAGTHAGFLHHGSLARPEVRVFQIAVTADARGKGVGRALVDRLLQRVAAAGAGGVSLRCLSFLEANRFWRSAGFDLHATEPGAKGTLNVWVRRMGCQSNGGGGGSPSGRFTFSSRVHACPGCGTPTVDTWVRGARRLALCPGCVAAAAMN